MAARAPDFTAEFGANAPFVAELFGRWKQDPAAVGDDWRDYFERLGAGDGEASAQPPVRTEPQQQPAPSEPASRPKDAAPPRSSPHPASRTEPIRGVAARIEDQLSADFQTGREQALESLDSARYLCLLDALDELVASPPFTAEADTPAKKAMSRLLARDAKRLRREVRAIDAAEDATARDHAFHEARKKAKRLRYAAEMATPVLGKRARSLAKSAKKIQTALGVHQDAVVARRRLRELAMQAHLGGDNAFTYGRLHALEQARAERVEAEFADAWRRFRRKQLPRWTSKPA